MDEGNKQVTQDEHGVHRHSKVITGFRTLDGALHWRYSTKNLGPDEDESIEVCYFVLQRNTPTPQQGAAMKTVLKQMENTSVPWLIASRKDWVFDLDQMRDKFKGLQEWDWCKGRVFVEPEFKVAQEGVDISGKRYYETYVIFNIHPELLGMTPTLIPPEIQLSLRDFQLHFPAPQKVAFIMMRFVTTPAHDKIVQGIRDALAPYGIEAVKANDKEWHTDLLYNVLTCIYGCSFGIAIFERIESEDFNPNVALEVGYIMALKKQVCLLKDRTLRSLHTDLVGKLYKTFDPQDPVASIPPELTKWMKDKKIV